MIKPIIITFPEGIDEVYFTNPQFPSGIEITLKHMENKSHLQVIELTAWDKRILIEYISRVFGELEPDSDYQDSVSIGYTFNTLIPEGIYLLQRCTEVLGKTVLANLSLRILHYMQEYPNISEILTKDITKKVPTYYRDINDLLQNP